MAQSVTWEQALEILKELKEKYSLSYCGPATPEEAEQVVAENKGYILFKYNGYEYLEQDLDHYFGVVDANGGSYQGDISLFYGLTDKFTFHHYTMFCREFTKRLNTLAGGDQYWLCEADLPYEYGIFPENSGTRASGLDEESEDSKKFQNQTNGQEPPARLF